MTRTFRLVTVLVAASWVSVASQQAPLARLSAEVLYWLSALAPARTLRFEELS